MWCLDTGTVTYLVDDVAGGNDVFTRPRCSCVAGAVLSSCEDLRVVATCRFCWGGRVSLRHALIGCQIVFLLIRLTNFVLAVCRQTYAFVDLFVEPSGSPFLVA